MDNSYTPPTTREEAADEIILTGFTITAMFAVAIAFPLPGELDDLRKFWNNNLDDYDRAYKRPIINRYLAAWGKGEMDL